MQRRFVIEMALASGLSLLRGFVLAVVMPVHAFGLYVAVVAFGTFGANLLGFGRIEQTNKHFPRLFAEGHGVQAVQQADSIVLLLIFRALVAVALGVVFVSAAIGGDAPFMTAAGVSVALAVAAQLVYASVHRASGELPSLARANLARTFLALVLAVLGGSSFGWPGAVFGEVAAATIAALLSRAYTARIAAPLARDNYSAVLEPERGYWLFAAYLLAAAPFYLDRLVVGTAYGGVAGGTYGVLMLFVTAAATVVGIVEQKVGPELVRIERSGAGVGDQLRISLRWSGIVTALNFLGVLSAALLLKGPAAPLAFKYDIDNSLLAAAMGMCLGRVTVLFDWLLLSRDRERAVFTAAAVSVLAMTAGGAIAVVSGSGLLAFVWALAAGKLIQLLLQLVFILGLRGRAV